MCQNATTSHILEQATAALSVWPDMLAAVMAEEAWER
jgi:hypothetical protein